VSPYFTLPVPASAVSPLLPCRPLLPLAS